MTRFKDTAYSRIESEIRKSFSARKRLFIGLLTGTSGLIILFLLVQKYVVKSIAVGAIKG